MLVGELYTWGILYQNVVGVPILIAFLYLWHVVQANVFSTRYILVSRVSIFPCWTR